MHGQNKNGFTLKWTVGFNIIQMAGQQLNTVEIQCEIERRDDPVAKNGHTALEWPREHPWPLHMPITDVIIPGVNGKQLAEKV